MSINNDKENEIQLSSEFNNLNISDDKDSNSVNINHENCYEPDDKLWCKECVPRDIIKGWTSENHEIDEFIKDTIYNARYYYDDVNHNKYPLFLEWVAFDKFTDIKKIGEGGFAKVYSATWIDGNAKYFKDDGSWKKLDPEPMKVALKRLNESQNISAEYLNELKLHWNIYSLNYMSLRFYGLTKDPETKEFTMIVQLANQGNLRSFLSNNFNNILWKDKIKILYDSAVDIKSFHDLGYVHKDIHSGNILQNYDSKSKISHSYISDFGQSGRPHEQKSDDKIYGVLPYIASEVLNGEKYTLSSDIYSFGIIMTELSSGKPPLYKRKHDERLALDICNGLRPEFGKGTPEIYKKLAYRCMNANPDQRPTANELYNIFDFWFCSRFDGYQEKEKFGYKGKEIKVMFEGANEEIPNISTSYEKVDAIYTSRVFTFSNLLTFSNSSTFSNLLKITRLWYKESVSNVIEGWTSENHDIDNPIKNTKYYNEYPLFLEWVLFDKFKDIEPIIKGQFAEVYSAIWIYGNAKYIKHDNNDGSWKKLDPKPMKVALKKLNGSQNVSAEYLNELETHWNLYSLNDKPLRFYGLTKDPKTNKEFIMIMQLTNQGSLHHILSSNFKSILWEDKIKILYDLIVDLKNLHEMGYFYKDLYNGNILQDYNPDLKAEEYHGVMPYIAPEVLNKRQYTSSSDIYSFGIIMTKLSSETPPFHNKKHDLSLSLAICNGLRPEFGKKTPKIYKELAYKCMDNDPNKRITARELFEIFDFWCNSINGAQQEKESFSYKGKEVKAAFFNAMHTARYTTRYTSKAYTFTNLIKTTRLWYKESVPNSIIEGWTTSENHDIDRFIKNTIYNAKYYFVEGDKYPLFLEWVPFNKFKDIEKIGKGGFAEVYSATWNDGNAKYAEQDDGSWKKLDSKPMKVALKRLNGSQNMSTEYLNELKTHWNLYSLNNKSLRFYGLTKDPNTKEFIMIMQFANQGSLHHILSNNFKNILWKDKIKILYDLTVDLKNLHKIGYFYKDFHSGNILQDYNPDLKIYYTYISDFGLSGPSYKQKSDDKVYGVMSYMSPEVLNRKQYTSASDIYSFGIIMTELSSGVPPFHHKIHDINLSLAICNGLKPGFGKGTPEIYKELARKCMDTDPNERITARELFEIFDFWCNSIDGTQESLGYKGKEVKAAFEEADKEIPNISTSYEKNLGAVYTSKALPINSSLNDEENDDEDYQDSRQCDLDIKFI